MAVEKSKREGMSSEAIRIAVLITLVLQNSTQALFMRYAFKKDDVDKPRAAPTTAVLMAEVCKLVCSFLLQRKDDGSWQMVYRTFRDDMWNKPWDTLKMAVPAFLYTFQNNLNYMAISNLDGPTFQLLYQLKILTTAIFSVTMLKRELGLKQWAALAMLALGVGLVQLSQTSSSASDDAQDGGDPADGDTSKSAQNPVLGFFFVMTACCTSGFAGVYFEKVLKGSSISLWVRNLQLSGFGIFFGTFLLYIVDGESVTTKGFFYGYNFSVAMAVLLNSLGGLVVAMVVKYADNVIKGFATSVSIVVTAVVSFFLLGFDITLLFLIGAYLVLHATFLYSQKKAAASQPDSSSTAGSATNGLPKKEVEMAPEKESLLPPSSEVPSSPRTRKSSAQARDRDATR